MVGLIVTGHGNFAEGLLSSLKLIAGEQEKVVGVNFLQEHSTENLKYALRREMDILGDEILVLTDLAGGSPFMNSVMLKREFNNKKIEVISGTNLPMLLELALGRGNMSVIDLAENALRAGNSGIDMFKIREAIIENPEAFGI